MFDVLLSAEFHPIVSVAWPSLSGLYVIALIVGGGLLVIATFFGGDADADLSMDADFDIDVDLDADVDTGAGVDGADAHSPTEALSLASWFSVRFVIYFCAMFGLVGTVLSYMSDLRPAVVLALAIVSGVVVGQIAHQVFRHLSRSSVDSSTSIVDYVKKPARVTVAIRPPARGEVAIQMGNSERYVPARTQRDDDRFEVGQSVGVVAFRGGTAVVVSRKEFEFLNESRKQEERS